MRIDINSRATGATKYTGDISLPGMAHAAVVRSDIPHGLIRKIDLTSALDLEETIAAYVADDVSERTFGRGVKDIPLLAREKVRYIGEPVAAIVAESRELAEAAAHLVEVEYEQLRPVLDPLEATQSNSPLVHS